MSRIRSAHGGALVAGVEIMILAASLVAGNIALVKALDTVLDLLHDGPPAAYCDRAGSHWTFSCNAWRASPTPPPEQPLREDRHRR
jgi:hypothetical protein